MKLELYHKGKFIVSIEPVGNVVSGDFTILPKRLVEGAVLNAESFDNLFFDCLDDCSHKEAYIKAEEIHQQYFGSQKYSGYESFANSKSHRHKK